MKKMLSVALALLMAVVLPVSLQAAEAADILGAWYGNMFGINVTLTLEEGGNYKMEMPVGDEGTTEGTWELAEDKVILDGDESSALTIEGESLKIADADMEIVFTREPVEAFSAAEPKTDATLEEYAGGWLGSKVSMFGMTIDCAAAGLDFITEIDGTDVTVSSVGMDMNESFPCEFADGALKIGTDTLAELAASSDTASEAAESANISFQLLQDGVLSANIDFAGENVVFYLNPASAEEIEAAKAAASTGASVGELIEDAIEEEATKAE